VESYLTDSDYRRTELVQSLVNPKNGYSSLRLAHYEFGDDRDWARLPEWNPSAVPVAVSELDAPVVDESGATSLDISDDSRRGSIDALRALGERAFFRYPVQLASAAELALASRDAADRYGFWIDDEHGVGGLVRVALPDGTTSLAPTCSSCHAGLRGGSLVVGAPNERLDWGALVADADATGSASFARAWGPGRLDVSSPSGTEPCRIADLRPVRFLRRLQADATVEHRNVASLAIRIETLIVTSHGEALRPPRQVALGLALFVDSLAGSLPPAGEHGSADGAALFDEHCSSCHEGSGLTGPPVAVQVIGTDPVLGESSDRGTGTYRVPSLRGVASRGPLLHDGAVPDLAALFDPRRLDEDYRGALHRSGPVPGHVYGLELAPSDRAALVAFLETL
jgi:cytochrome c5